MSSLVILDIQLGIDGGFDFVHHFDEINLAFGHVFQDFICGQLHFNVPEFVFVIDLDRFLLFFEFGDVFGLFMVGIQQF